MWTRTLNSASFDYLMNVKEQVAEQTLSGESAILGTSFLAKIILFPQVLAIDGLSIASLLLILQISSWSSRPRNALSLTSLPANPDLSFSRVPPCLFAPALNFLDISSD